MKRLSVLFIALLFVAVIGCDGDDGGTTPAPPPAPGPGPGGGDGNGDGGGGVVIGGGGGSAPDGVATMFATVDIPGAGTVIATVTWSGAPAQLVAFFKKPADATNYGWVNSGSPMVSTTTAAGAEAGWMLYVANTTGTDAVVSVSIVFIAD